MLLTRAIRGRRMEPKRQHDVTSSDPALRFDHFPGALARVQGFPRSARRWRDLDTRGALPFWRAIAGASAYWCGWLRGPFLAVHQGALERRTARRIRAPLRGRSIGCAFATHSDRGIDPVLTYAVPVATARSAMNVSSASRDRCGITCSTRPGSGTLIGPPTRDQRLKSVHSEGRRAVRNALSTARRSIAS